VGSRTHFEQVPLESIPKDCEREIRQLGQRSPVRELGLWKRENRVSAPFDIFQTEAGGAALWCGIAGTLEEAKTHIGELAAVSPGEYVILNRRTGDRVVVQSQGIDSE